MCDEGVIGGHEGVVGRFVSTGGVGEREEMKRVDFELSSRATDKLGIEGGGYIICLSQAMPRHRRGR